MKFAQAHRAQLHWFLEVLLEVVGAVHDAAVVDAVAHTEHMANFVHHNLNRTVEDLLVVGHVVLFLKKVFVVAGK